MKGMGGICFLQLFCRRCSKMQLAVKCWSLPTSLHSVTSQKPIILHPPIPCTLYPVPSHADKNSNSACFTVVHLPLLLTNIKATEMYKIAENRFGYIWTQSYVPHETRCRPASHIFPEPGSKKVNTGYSNWVGSY